MNFYHCEIAHGGLGLLRIESRMHTKTGCYLTFTFGSQASESIRLPICNELRPTSALNWMTLTK